MWPSPHTVDVLMYHSISSGDGPIYLPPAVLRDHLAILQDCGYHVIALTTLAAWLRSEVALSSRAVVLTFDDGFADFASSAFPAIQPYGWPVTVFLPTNKMGGVNDWERSAPGAPARPLMDWSTIAELAQLGVDFGAHGVTHTDLTTVSPAMLQEETVRCKETLEAHTGHRVTSFAPPYGRSNAVVRAALAQHYGVAVGTTLAHTSRTSPLYDVPRVEMWYFRNPRLWRAYLKGQAPGYFLLRQTLRAVRSLVLSP